MSNKEDAMSDREYLVQTLCQQILGMRSPDGSVPRATSGIESAASAHVSVEIRGVVQNVRRQIWIDSAAYTERIVAEIEKQAGEIDLDALIAKQVREEIQRTLSRLADVIRDRVTSIVNEAITRRVGKLPEQLARKFASKLWDQAYKP